jgi:hypothetical protein
MNDTPPNREFRSLYCERFTCAPADFEKRVFQNCLYPHARMIAPLLRLLNPAVFERDYLFIQSLGNAKGWKDVKSELVALRYEDCFYPRFLRNALRLRISRRKAKQLAARLFPARASFHLLPDTEGSPQKAAGALHGEKHQTPERPPFGLRSEEHS